MPDYDFRSLSDYDFELLSRDLLQKELALTLESFSKGRDGGIDFRYKTSDANVIVQCKHYVDFAALLRTIRKHEIKKLSKLKPSRYILVVSTPLTPGRKEELEIVLKPYLSSLSDIYGREDLNNLLGKFPEIERKNFKLWLTSDQVLNKVMNSGIWLDAELTLDRIRRRASIYVPNPSLGRARELLESHHYCIIAGIPGIGKTTLAEVLLIEYVDLHNYQAVRIGNDLSEIKNVKRKNSRQVFYFDDFLGTTALDKLQKNEDKRLIDFMEEVACNEHWRFLMTTREYILNVANRRYESFYLSSFKLHPCIVQLEDYTNAIRARILYNHIYFSDLGPEYKLELLKEGRYHQLLGHPNFNPRIVEHMTSKARVAGIQPAAYYQHFVSNLVDPTKVWDHAFRNQLGEGAQHLLLVMASLGDQTLISDLEYAFTSFYQYRQSRLNFSIGSRDFEQAIKELDGNFVATKRVGPAHIATFHNPSVRDYLEGYLTRASREVLDLMTSATFFDQLQRLWQGRRGRAFAGIRENQPLYIEQLHRLLSAPVSRLIGVAGRRGGVIDMSHWQISLESRAEFVLDVTATMPDIVKGRLLEHLFALLDARIQTGATDRYALIRLLQKLQAAHVHPDEARILKAAATFLTERLDTLDEYSSVSFFLECFPAALDSEQLSTLREEFTAFCEDYDPMWSADNANELNSSADDMENIASKLNADVNEVIEKMRTRAAEWETESEPEYDQEERFQDSESEVSPASTENVNEMFERLIDSLKQS